MHLDFGTVGYEGAVLTFEIVIALVLGGALLTLLSKRIGAPYPAMVALAGAALALFPGAPSLTLDPELALTLFVAPVLLDAAFDSSLRDLRANWKPIAGLALGAVIVTVVAVAVVVRWMVPEMPWSIAIALGAIVAPPDAAAATAVLKQLKPPQRLLVILEGESLFNDAIALLVFRIAVGVAVSGATMTAGEAVPLLAWVTIGSLVLGVVLSYLFMFFTQRLEDIAIAVVFQFGGTFAVWMLAERLHLSGILTVVAFAMATGRRAPAIIPARVRIPSFAIWEFTVFVLNVLAFILVGFSLKDILQRVDAGTLTRYAWIAAAVFGATVLARIVYVVLVALFGAKDARSRKAEAVVAWCGMRGIVTLAAALGLPLVTSSGATFPHRDLIVFVAFFVVLGTLVVQGMTLKPLLRRLALEDDGLVEKEVRLARVEMLRAGATAMDALAGEFADVLRRRYAVMLTRALADQNAEPHSEGGGPVQRESAEHDQELVRAATEAERKKLLDLRSTGVIGDAAFQRVEQELDWEELHLSPRAEG